MKKWIMIIVFMMLSILLAACNESKTNALELTGYPSSVQDGTVSSIFYDEYRDFTKSNDNFSSEATSALSNVTSQTEQRFVDIMNRHDEYLADVTFTPTTVADTEIFDALKQYIEGQKYINTTLFLYVSTNDKELSSTFEEVLEDAVTSNQKEKERLKDILNKYNIN